eukprot:5330774-Prymnesium_polylepis.1
MRLRGAFVVRLSIFGPSVGRQSMLHVRNADLMEPISAHCGGSAENTPPTNQLLGGGVRKIPHQPTNLGQRVRNPYWQPGKTAGCRLRSDGLGWFYTGWH